MQLGALVVTVDPMGQPVAPGLFRVTRVKSSTVWFSPGDVIAVPATAGKGSASERNGHVLIGAGKGVEEGRLL